MTNSEMIHSMTDDELAEAFCEYIDCDCCPALYLCKLNEGESNGLKKWLKKEVEDGERKDGDSDETD